MFRWRGEAVDRLLDEAHADLVDATARLLGRLGWEVEIETTFAIDREHGSIDIFAWHGVARVVLVGEVKSVVPDSQATIAILDRKARLAIRIARDRGWDPVTVGRILLVGEGTTARRRVARHAAMFGAAFPDRGRTIHAWRRKPVGSLSGLLFLHPGTDLPPNSRAMGFGQRRAGQASGRPVSRGRRRLQNPTPCGVWWEPVDGDGSSPMSEA